MDQKKKKMLSDLYLDEKRFDKNSQKNILKWLAGDGSVSGFVIIGFL